MTLTATAGAHIIRPGCTSKVPARAELHCARANRQHALATILWARAAQRNLTALDATTAIVLSRVVRDHRWLYHAMTARIGEAQRRLLAASRPAHYALWMCIHGGEGAWGATNPNGHYNGLQMTWGWGELVGNPNDYSPMQVIWAAEHALQSAMQRGRAYALQWLNGQWGQTIGPCWQYV